MRIHRRIAAAIYSPLLRCERPGQAAAGLAFSASQEIHKLKPMPAFWLRMQFVVVAAISLTHTPGSAYCYTVYKGDSLVYKAQSAPVDTSRPYSETVPAKFGAGAMMVVDVSSIDCPQESELTDIVAYHNLERPGTVAGDSPETTRALGRLALRHTGSSDNSSVLHEASSDSFRAGTYSKGPIMTGPRGGQFYWNSNGGKTYVSGGGSRRR